jgi:hypothetical protein
MNYILRTKITGGTYYVQKYEGKYVLNGLQDNAMVMRTRVGAIKVKKEAAVKLKPGFKYDLDIQEIGIETKSP